MRGLWAVCEASALVETERAGTTANVGKPSGLLNLDSVDALSEIGVSLF